MGLVLLVVALTGVGFVVTHFTIEDRDAERAADALIAAIGQFVIAGVFLLQGAPVPTTMPNVGGGAFFVWLAWHHWRHRKKRRPSLVAGIVGKVKGRHGLKVIPV